MARSQEKSFKPIYDDLEEEQSPKTIVAWYDVTNPSLTYADKDGKNAAEPAMLYPIPDTENVGDWKMVEVWTAQKNKEQIEGNYDRLKDADSAGSYVVKEKKEWDDLLQQIADLEAENADLRKRPAAGGGERRKYGTGPKRKNTEPMRIWLLVNGHEVSSRGRVPDDKQDKYNEANPSGDYEPTADDLKAWEAFKSGEPARAAGEGEEGEEDAHESRSEREALERVAASPGAPEADDDEDPDYSDDEIKAKLKEHEIKFSRNLTDALRIKGIDLIEARKPGADA